MIHVIYIYIHMYIYIYDICIISMVSKSIVVRLPSVTCPGSELTVSKACAPTTQLEPWGPSGKP